MPPPAKGQVFISSKESFKALDGVEFFDPKNPQVVVEGLHYH
jgi:hypothetical protein